MSAVASVERCKVGERVNGFRVDADVCEWCGWPSDPGDRIYLNEDGAFCSRECAVRALGPVRVVPAGSLSSLY